MQNHLRPLIALLTAIAFLITSCSWTKEISRRTVRVEKEQIQGEPEFDKPDLGLKYEGQCIKIITQGRYFIKVKETDIEEIHLREKKMKQKNQDELTKNVLLFGILTCGVVLVLAIIIIPMLQPADEISDFRYYTETERAKERIVKEEITIPAKDVPLVVKVNDFELSFKSNHDGKAELNLLPVINKFGTIPNELKVTCTAKIRDKTATEELTIPEIEVLKIVQFETGRPQLSPNLAASINFEKSGGTLQAGDSDKLVVAVTNKGGGEAYQLKGTVLCPDPILDRKEVIFGRVDPGRTKKGSVAFEVPKEYPSKTLPIEIHFSEYNKYNPEPVEIYLRIVP